jgi:guanylate kinase
VTPAGRLVVLAAPSGAGKTTIAQTLMTRRPDVDFSISATTRAPRPGERDGVDYHFVAREEFDRRIKAGEFLEWAEYAGNRYGSLRGEVDRIRQAGRHVLLDIEVQGAAQVRRAYPWPHSVAIFLLPPSAGELIRRLEGRGTETPMALWRRLDQARHELTAAGKFDVIVVNDDLEHAVTDVGRAIDSESPPVIAPAMQDRVKALIRDLTKGTK